MVLARTLFFFELTTCSRELATLLVATLGGSFSLEFLELPRLSLEPGLRSINSIMGFALMASLIALLLVLLVSPLVTKLDLDSLTMLLLDHSDKLEIVLARTDLGRKFRFRDQSTSPLLCGTADCLSGATVFLHVLLGAARERRPGLMVGGAVGGHPAQVA